MSAISRRAIEHYCFIITPLLDHYDRGCLLMIELPPMPPPRDADALPPPIAAPLPAVFAASCHNITSCRAAE